MRVPHTRSGYNPVRPEACGNCGGADLTFHGSAWSVGDNGGGPITHDGGLFAECGRCGWSLWYGRQVGDGPLLPHHAIHRTGLDPERLAAAIRAAEPTDAGYAGRAGFNARLAARPCCRAIGTICPACRKADRESPVWLVRLRNLRDALRAWRRG